MSESQPSPEKGRLCIERIDLNGFRNLSQQKINLGGRFNLFTGENAQGKTNFLEAVSVLCDLRSFRGARPTELIGKGEEKAFLSCIAVAIGLDYEVRIEIMKGKINLQVNEKTVSRKKDYIGKLPVVVFSTEDVRLPKGEPEARRRFLDRALFLVQPAHWKRLVLYKHLLKRRNLLLREKRTSEPMFQVYTEKMANTGAEISFQRHRLAESLARRVEEATRAISGAGEGIGVRYNTHLAEQDGQLISDGGEKLLALLNGAVSADRERGWTSVGPQVEDLKLTLYGRPAAKFASQGQQRTIALALKISEIEVIRQIRGIFPTLLIDDLSSELDRGRRERLFAYLKRTGGQVLLTSTEFDSAKLFEGEEFRRFDVKNGRITEI